MGALFALACPALGFADETAPIPAPGAPSADAERIAALERRVAELELRMSAFAEPPGEEDAPTEAMEQEALQAKLQREPSLENTGFRAQRQKPGEEALHGEYEVDSLAGDIALVRVLPHLLGEGLPEGFRAGVGLGWHVGSARFGFRLHA
jgi:hypothetical protein